jgi:hypothetical protein
LIKRIFKGLCFFNNKNLEPGGTATIELPLRRTLVLPQLHGAFASLHYKFAKANFPFYKKAAMKIYKYK